MNRSARRSSEFWDDLERNVANRVQHALREGDARRASLITYPREVETMVRTECDRRQTVPIIASGRSLLGDRGQLGPSDGPFAYT